MELTTQQIKQLRRVRGVNRVRLAMKLAGVTQEQLGAAIGKPQTSISDIVNDRHQTSVETARAIARAFGCAIDDLFPAREAVAS